MAGFKVIRESIIMGLRALMVSREFADINQIHSGRHQGRRLFRLNMAVFFLMHREIP